MVLAQHFFQTLARQRLDTPDRHSTWLDGKPGDDASKAVARASGLLEEVLNSVPADSNWAVGAARNLKAAVTARLAAANEAIHMRVSLRQVQSF